MPPDPDPLLLKRRLTPLLLPLKGVSGLGVRDNHVMVYLEADDAEVRQKVQEVADGAAPEAPLRFEVSGAFGAQ